MALRHTNNDNWHNDTQQKRGCEDNQYSDTRHNDARHYNTQLWDT